MHPPFLSYICLVFDKCIWRLRESPKKALSVALTMRPDIVLSDVLMPGISGIEMAIRMRQTLSDTKIVLLSGQASTAELIREAANAGHDFELLAKPIHPEELVAKLKQLLQSDQR